MNWRILALACVLRLSAQTVVVRNVRIFDGDRLLPRRSVLWEGAVIKAVGDNVRSPSNSESIDGQGKTLIPGLIDAHTHTSAPSELKEALAFGVTTELDLFSHPANIAALRALEQSGHAHDMADARFAGICATAPGGHGTEYNFPIPTITRPEQAQAFVDERLTEGSDYLKVIYSAGYSGTPNPRPNLSRETMRALIQAAHRRGRLAIVHVDTAPESRDAIEAGADVLAHIYVAAAADPAIAALASKQNTVVIPTLSIRSNLCGSNPGRELISDPLITPYLIAASRVGLSVDQRIPPWLNCNGVKPAVDDLRRAGVRILAGTDAPNPGTAHGASLHGELELLVDAGITPIEALKAATSATADTFHLYDRGRVAPGKRADILLVDGDPTTNIGATRHIVAVWKQGRRLDREAYRASIPTLDASVVPPGLKAGLVSSFNDGSTRTAFGPSWEAFDGVEIKLVAGGGLASREALMMLGNVAPNRPSYLWPGIVFTPSGLRRTPADLSSKSGLRFWAKGDGRTYRVVLVGAGGQRDFQERAFKPTADWQEYHFAFADFQGVASNQIQSVILAASHDIGHFEIYFDEISFY
jgi:imidazolonepropionase-like amidohydrolase